MASPAGQDAVRQPGRARSATVKRIDARLRGRERAGTILMSASPSPSFTLAMLALFLAPVFAHADEPKLPIDSDEKGSVYVAPKVTPTETSMEAHGATVGVQRKDGSGLYGGMDTSTTRPTYSVGGSTGGDVSFSAGAESDGKDRHGVKAGVQIKY